MMNSSWRHHEDILKTSWRHHEVRMKSSWSYLEVILRLSWSMLKVMSQKVEEWMLCCTLCRTDGQTDRQTDRQTEWHLELLSEPKIKVSKTLHIRHKSCRIPLWSEWWSCHYIPIGINVGSYWEFGHKVYVSQGRAGFDNDRHHSDINTNTKYQFPWTLEFPL